MPPALKRITKILLPLVLIALAVLVTRMWRGNSVPALSEGGTYEVWIREAEVHPSGINGDSWDADQSGPDLVGLLCWKDQKILETIPAADGLIARWEPVAVKPVDLLLKGGADAASLRRVGRFRMESGGVIEIGVFDDDAIDREFSGGFSVALESLRLGVNVIKGNALLTRVELVIEDPEALDQAPSGKHGAEDGVMALAGPTEPMRTQSSRVTDSLEKSLQGASEALEREIDRQGQEVKGAFDALKQGLEEALPR
jgi:hypothetical protein